MTRDEFCALRPGDVIREKQHNAYDKTVVSVHLGPLVRAVRGTRTTTITKWQRYDIVRKADPQVVVSRTDLEAAAMDVDFRAEAYEAAGWQISAAATRALADRLRAVLNTENQT